MFLPEKRKILLIINPNAGKMKSRSGTFDIINHLSSNNCIVTVHCTIGPNDAKNTVLLHAKGHDLIICCGGDGTLNEVISGVLSLPEKLPIGYIPAGSTNDFARTLEIPLKIKKSSQLVVNGTPSPIDIGKMNDENYFSYVASFGAFTKVSYSTSQKLKNKIGHAAYILGGLKQLGELHPYQLKVTTNKMCTTGNFIFGAVTNTTSIGGILNLNKHDVDLCDGNFEVLLVRNPNNPLDLSAILQGLLKRRYDARHIVFFRTNRIEFEFESPASWTIDGEFGGKHQKVVIENLHEAINILR